ncbi:MAG: ATP cone domain-containing protein, partial [Candidatus Neomarinimicrobiota bacterium]
MFRTQVTKRNGQLENVSFDKITERIQSMLMKEPKITNIDPIKIAQAICTRIHHAIHTSELDNLAAEYCISMAYQHPNYSTLASRL